jgi:hypothetical protein
MVGTARGPLWSLTDSVAIAFATRRWRRLTLGGGNDASPSLEPYSTPCDAWQRPPERF